MTSDTDRLPSAETLSVLWHQEHEALNNFFDQLRKWAYDVSQLGIPHFGEAADRLKRLRERLVTHFDRENDLVEQFAASKEGSISPEIEANRRQVAHDHERLLGRLDELIGKLSALEPPYTSWQEATQEIELFVDVLEQHEEQEGDSISWLTPRHSS